MSPGLRSFIRHAERFGPPARLGDCRRIDPAAPDVRHRSDLDPLDLGRLSLRLQNIAPRWRLPREHGFTLARQLLGDGHDVKTGARMTMLSVPTTRKVRALPGGNMSALTAPTAARR